MYYRGFGCGALCLLFILLLGMYMWPCWFMESRPLIAVQPEEAWAPDTMKHQVLIICPGCLPECKRNKLQSNLNYCHLGLSVIAETNSNKHYH